MRREGIAVAERQDGYLSGARRGRDAPVRILYREYIQVGQFKHGSALPPPGLRRFRGAMTYILAGIRRRTEIHPGATTILSPIFCVLESISNHRFRF